MRQSRRPETRDARKKPADLPSKVKFTHPSSFSIMLRDMLKSNRKKTFQFKPKKSGPEARTRPRGVEGSDLQRKNGSKFPGAVVDTLRVQPGPGDCLVGKASAVAPPPLDRRLVALAHRVTQILKSSTKLKNHIRINSNPLNSCDWRGCMYLWR